MKRIYILLIALFFSGCASHVGVNPLFDQEFPPTQNVQVLTTPPAEHFIKIAEISSKDNSTQDIIEKAKELGADAVVLEEQKQANVPYLTIGSKSFYHKRPRLTALAIKMRSNLSNLTPPPEVPAKPQKPKKEKKIKKPKQSKKAKQSEPPKPVPLETPAKSEKPPAQPKQYLTDRFYAVLESEHKNVSKERSTRTNYLMISKTDDRQSCMSLVDVPKNEYVFADCLKNEALYDTIFEYQPIGQWYVSFEAVGGMQKAVVIKFGPKFDERGQESNWSYEDSFEVAKELRDQIYAKARAANMDPKIRVFSPKEELKIS